MKAPFLFGVEDQSMAIAENVIQCLEQECIFYNHPCGETIMELCRCVIVENNLAGNVTNPYEAVTIIYQLLEQN